MNRTSMIYTILITFLYLLASSNLGQSHQMKLAYKHEGNHVFVCATLDEIVLGFDIL